MFGLTMELLPCLPHKEGGQISCCGAEAISSAKNVCRQLGIPHYVLNLREQFQKKVIDYFCDEYLAGRTPNPCVKCNQYIKFDLLLKKARALGVDYLATGHYAHKGEIKNQNAKCKITNQNAKIVYQLLKGKDKEKDQSYFLYCLTQQQLKYVLFPLGDLTKKQVRQIAKRARLSVAQRSESQEICFVTDNNYQKFLKQNSKKTVRPGMILDKKGTVIGKHQGIAFYTTGQRKGLGISSAKPFYVIKIDVKKNALVVGEEKDLYQKECLVKDVSWISGQAPKLPMKVMVKIRYRHPATIATLTRKPVNSSTHKLTFAVSQRAITPGQAAVFYRGDEILGGGTIE